MLKQIMATIPIVITGLLGLWACGEYLGVKLTLFSFALFGSLCWSIVYWIDRWTFGRRRIR